MSDSDRMVLVTALHCVYEEVVNALDKIESGDTRNAVFALRRLLPAGYKHSFEKDKKSA